MSLFAMLFVPRILEGRIPQINFVQINSSVCNANPTTINFVKIMAWRKNGSLDLSRLFLEWSIQIINIEKLLLSEEFDFDSSIAIMTIEPIYSLILLFSAKFPISHTIFDVKLDSCRVLYVAFIRALNCHITETKRVICNILTSAFSTLNFPMLLAFTMSPLISYD